MVVDQTAASFPVETMGEVRAAPELRACITRLACRPSRALRARRQPVQDGDPGLSVGRQLKRTEVF